MDPYGLFHSCDESNLCDCVNHCGGGGKQLPVFTLTFCCTFLATTMLQLCKKLLNIGTQQIPYPNGNHNS